MPLVDRPLDQRVLRLQVENVELVDPRRNNEEGALPNFRRRGSILDELHKAVLEYDLPRRRRNVLAETKSIHVGHRDRKAAVAAAEIGKQVLQPVEQVLSPGIQRGSEDLRVGCDEVRGRDGVDELTRVEIDLASRGLIHA